MGHFFLEKLVFVWVYFQIPWRHIPTKTKLEYPPGILEGPVRVTAGVWSSLAVYHMTNRPVHKRDEVLRVPDATSYRLNCKSSIRFIFVTYYYNWMNDLHQDIHYCMFKSGSHLAGYKCYHIGGICLFIVDNDDLQWKALFRAMTSRNLGRPTCLI